MKYTLSEFSKIQSSTGVLSSNDIKRLQTLTKKINVSSYKKPQYKRKYNNQRNVKPKQQTEMNWELIRSFKKTVLDKNAKDSDEGIFDNIRGILNKMTMDNYSDKKKELFNELSLLINRKQHAINRFAFESDSDDSSDDEAIETFTKDENEKLLKIGKIIFDIASKYIFWAELFANLYEDIIKKYHIMKGIAVKNFNDYSTLMYNIKNVDPEKDYDEFCRINKINEKRRSLSKFFTILANKKILSIENIVTILEKFIELVNTKIKEDNCLKDVEELSENIEIIINAGLVKCKKHDKWVNIVEKINEISSYNVKSYPSLNRRIIFKFMDCIDVIKKV
tara:strand:- start:10915 stop:11922 length:1008 start_codon:yes stop_codon:yes gene_type:complete